MADFGAVSLSLFAATTVVIFVYAFICLISVGISLAVIFKGREEFSKGHIRKFINAFSATLAVSFLYAVWNILTRLKVIKIDNIIFENTLDNALLIVFIMLLTYVAYLAREFSKKFGFKSAGKKISDNARKKK